MSHTRFYSFFYFAELSWTACISRRRAIRILNTGVIDKRAAKKAQMLLSALHTEILGGVLNNYKTPYQYNY